MLASASKLRPLIVPRPPPSASDTVEASTIDPPTDNAGPVDLELDDIRLHGVTPEDLGFSAPTP